MTSYHSLQTLNQDDVLYHWSPRSRRKRIEHDGLKPGVWTVDRVWRPPYVAFAMNPVMGWNLATSHRRGEHIYHGQWDLWSVVACDLNGWELLFDHYIDTARQYIYEVRTYERIFKRHLTWVAERTL